MAAVHHFGRGRSALSSGIDDEVEIADSTPETIPRPLAEDEERCRPCQTSDPSEYHMSLSFIHAHKARSYEWAMPVEQCMMGAPLGRTVAARMVLDGALRRGMRDVGGKVAVCFLTFLFGVSPVFEHTVNEK
jgi:hypothetical protein